jgi:hypothetical protein
VEGDLTFTADTPYVPIVVSEFTLAQAVQAALEQRLSPQVRAKVRVDMNADPAATLPDANGTPVP